MLGARLRVPMIRKGFNELDNYFYLINKFFSASPSNYDLFLAEEDSLEYDDELPPQDRRRRVADCGFPALALVARGRPSRRSSSLRSQLQANMC